MLLVRLGGQSSLFVLQLVDGLRGNLGADEVDRLEAFDVLEGIESCVGDLGVAECQNWRFLRPLS